MLADPDRAAQVMANLIENALRYARHEVRVTTARRRGQAEFSVADDGPGIPLEDQSRVFRRLFPDRARTDRPIGSGLGLTIVAELVDAMGGSVRVESPTSSDGGTRMVVVLPLAPPGASVEDEPAGASAHPPIMPALRQEGRAGTI